MGEPELIAELGSERAFTDLAAGSARALRAAQVWPLVIGLAGDLGSGKTTWVRAMLRGLEFSGRVPSPTYTLLVQYACGELTVVLHVEVLARSDADGEWQQNRLSQDRAAQARALLIGLDVPPEILHASGVGLRGDPKAVRAAYFKVALTR